MTSSVTFFVNPSARSIVTSIRCEPPGLSEKSYVLSLTLSTSLDAATDTVCMITGQCPRPPPG